jgi:hypothetical protein
MERLMQSLSSSQQVLPAAMELEVIETMVGAAQSIDAGVTPLSPSK